MSSSIEIKFNLPNLGTLVFYTICVLLIPGILIQTSQYNVFNYYFPFIVMLASALTESGKPRYFQSLYPQETKDFASFLSKGILQLLAVTAILVNTLMTSMATNDLSLGLYTGLIAFFLTFPVANRVIPYLIDRTDYVLKTKILRDKVALPGNWHKYFTGIIFIFVFMVCQVILNRLIHNLVIGKNMYSNTRANNLH